MIVTFLIIAGSASAWNVTVQGSILFFFALVEGSILYYVCVFFLSIVNLKVNSLSKMLYKIIHAPSLSGDLIMPFLCMVVQRGTGRREIEVKLKKILL